MPGRTCCVFGCFNNSVKIQEWNKAVCELHKPLSHVECSCLRPYGLHRFPGRAEDKDVRRMWIKYVNRDGFEPNKNTAVCGIHFPDGRPTEANPYPVLFMGYDCHAQPARPPPKRRCLQPLHQNSSTEPEVTETDLDVGNLEDMPVQTRDVTPARPPPKRRCLQPLHQNSTTEPEATGTDLDVGNLEDMPVQTHDVGIHWPDHIDHNYSFSCGNKVTDEGTVIVQPMDMSHKQACIDLQNATQVITQVLQHAVGKNQELCVLMRRLKEREADAARRLAEQVEANEQLELKMEELHKRLEEKDNSLTQVNQTVAFLRNKLKDLHQHLPVEETQEGTFLEWLQGKECGLQSHLVSSAPILLESPISELKEQKREEEADDDDDDGDGGGLYVEEHNPIEDHSVSELNQIQLLNVDEIKVEGADYEEPSWSDTSASDIKIELIQEEENGLNVTPVLRSIPTRDAMSAADPLHLGRLSVKRVDCCKMQGPSGTEKSRDGEQHESVNLEEPPALTSTPPHESATQIWTEAIASSTFSPVSSFVSSPKPEGSGTFSQTVCEDFKMEEEEEGEGEASTGQEQHHCSQCGERFHELGHLKVHQRVHTGEAPYGRSEDQPYKFTHSEDKPYKCTQCDKSFNHTSSLARHRHAHTGEGPHECTHCGKRFLKKLNLTVHERLHSREMPHQCAMCGKSFRNMGNLIIHMRSHSGEKAFGCTQCGRRYHHKSNLNAHMRTHSGEKPYKCGQCDKVFSHASSLARHRLAHTGEMPHGCAHCGKRFLYKHNLTVHERRHTGETPLMYSVRQEAPSQGQSPCLQQGIQPGRN